MKDILRINIYTEKMTLEPRDSTCSKDLELKADTPCWEAAPAEVSNGLSALWWHGTPSCAAPLVGAVPNTCKEQEGYE